MKSTALSACLLAVLVLATAAPPLYAQSQSFTLGASLRLGAPAAGGDYDNDGLLDVLQPAFLTRNNGGMTFSNTPLRFEDIMGSLAWADYNNDGFLDFVVTGDNYDWHRFVTKLLRNRGDGTFSTNLVSGLPDVGYRSASAWGDADNDGRLDLLLTGSTNWSYPGYISGLYRNLGNGTFTNVPLPVPGLAFSSVAWGDYDNDGHLDFAVAGEAGGLPGLITRIYRNQGDGTFLDIAAGLPGVANGSVAWGDYDNDGYLDLLLTGEQGSTRITSIYHNNGNGTFTQIPTALPGVYYGSGVWGDFNNDSFLDVFLIGNASTGSISRVYAGNGAGTFSDVQAGLPGTGSGNAEWGDFDIDGRLDLLLACDGFTRIYRNITPSQKQSPTPPSGLKTILLPHNSVDLFWTPPPETPSARSNGVYYNLRVGTSPNGIDVMSPHSDAVTGARRLASFGNAGHTNHWFLSNLPRATYYWSVQTIDPGLTGSTFAPETSFTITNDLDLATDQAPVAFSQSVCLPEDASLPITLTGSDPDGDPLTFSIIRPPGYGTFRGTPPNLIYFPLTNFFGQDSFEFRVKDGLLVSSNATVTVLVNPVPDTSELRVSIFLDVFNRWTLNVSGEPYQGYALEGSTNLLSWDRISAWTNGYFATSILVDTNGFPSRFFRARSFP